MGDCACYNESDAFSVETYAHGLLGANFLSCFDISISYSQHIINTEPIPSTIFSFTP